MKHLQLENTRKTRPGKTLKTMRNLILSPCRACEKKLRVNSPIVDWVGEKVATRKHSPSPVWQNPKIHSLVMTSSRHSKKELDGKL